MVIRVFEGRAPKVVIPDTNFIVDLDDWINGRAGAGERLRESFSAILSARSDGGPVTVSLWPALAEYAWSRIPDLGVGCEDLDERLNLAAKITRLLHEVFDRLFHSKGRDEWLTGSPPGWVRALEKEFLTPLVHHKWTVSAGNEAWITRSATALLAFSKLEPINKGANEQFRVELFSRYLEIAVDRAGTIGSLEAIYTLLRLFAPSPKGRLVEGVDPFAVVKVKRPWRSQTLLVQDALNTVRDLAMVRYAHDAAMGCGHFDESGPRPSAILTSDRGLQAFANWMPSPDFVRKGVIAYDFSGVLSRLNIEDETRRMLSEVLLSVEAGAVRRIDGRADDHDELGEVTANLFDLASELVE